MLPKIFSKNFQDPMAIYSSNIEYYRSPLLTSLSYDNMKYNKSVKIEVTTSSPTGDDIIYALTILPSLQEIETVEYTICIPYSLPNEFETYVGGLFRHSLECNLDKFGKYEMLYIPVIFQEFFTNVEVGYVDNPVVSIGLGGRHTYQPTHRGPVEIKGRMIMFNKSIPPQKIINKQKHRAHRSCIFK